MFARFLAGASLTALNTNKSNQPRDEVGVMAGSAALLVECRKHDSNDPKCSELGWKCTPQLRPMVAGVLRPGTHYCVLPLIQRDQLQVHQASESSTF